MGGPGASLETVAMRNDEERSVKLIDASLGLGQLRVKSGNAPNERNYSAFHSGPDIRRVMSRALVLLVARDRRGLDAAELLER